MASGLYGYHDNPYHDDPNHDTCDHIDSDSDNRVMEPDNSVYNDKISGICNYCAVQ